MSWTFNPFTSTFDYYTTATVPDILIWKGAIAVPSDFPTLAAVLTGWVYTITTNVEDSDATKTHTHQTFVAGDEIVWNGSAWVNIGGVLSGYVTSPLSTSTATNLTGFIKGNGSILSADNSTYLTTTGDGAGLSNVVHTEVDPVVGAINGVVKANGAGVISACSNLTDVAYLTSLSGAVLTTGNQSIAGIKTLSDATEASNATTGGTIVSGGLAVAKRVYATDMTVTNKATMSISGKADTAGNADTVTTNANLTGAVTSVGNATTLVGGVKNDGTVNPTNLLSNGDFENWSAGIKAEAVNQQGTSTDATKLLGDSSGIEYRRAESFIISGATLVTAVEVRRTGVSGSPSGNWTLRIETDTADTHLPSGTLANANASIVVVPPADNTVIKGTFATAFNLTVGVKYWLVVQCDNQATGVFWTLSGTDTTSYANGNLAYSSDGGWVDVPGQDLYFKIYTQDWNAPDGWTLAGANGSVARESTIVKRGTYSAKLTRAGTDTYMYQELYANMGGVYVRGRKYTYSRLVYATQANSARISIDNGAGGLYSSYHSGTPGWELLSLAFTADASATYIYAYCYLNNNDTSAYFDAGMLNEGESAFAFADKPAGEGVSADYFATSTKVGWAAGLTGYIFTKKIGKRVFVDYYINGTSSTAAASFTLPYTSANNGVTICSTVGYALDNTSTSKDATVQISPNSATVYIYSDRATGAGWTASGTKIITGQLNYESV